MDSDKKIGILMLHGFTGCPGQFKELADFFGDKNFYISIPTIAGHGTSPKDLIKTNPEDWKKSVKDAYLDLKQKTDKIFIIGNSFGSNLGLYLAKEFNNEPSGIVSLSAPIYLKYHKFILSRLYTYGLFRRYYRKPRRVYKNPFAFLKSLFYKKEQAVKNAEFLGRSDYDVIPVKSFKEFLRFIKKETMPNLKKISAPIFIAHSETDPVVLPKSAEYIYKNIASEKKQFFWFSCSQHIMIRNSNNQELYEKIYKFIGEVSES